MCTEASIGREQRELAIEVLRTARYLLLSYASCTSGVEHLHVIHDSDS